MLCPVHKSNPCCFIKGNDDDDDEEAADSEDDADQQKIMKQVNFPPDIERADVQASGLVAKVSKAIQKRLEKLGGHKDKLEKMANKTDTQTKFLKLQVTSWFGKMKDMALFGGNCRHHRNQPTNFVCTLRLLEKVISLHKNLFGIDEEICESYSSGLVNGFTKGSLPE